jgi:peptide deformylase
MPFTVGWEPRARSALADIWNHAPDQAGVSLAANQIDIDLRRDPFRDTENRGAYRCKKVPPLLVLFEVFPDDCKVNVFHVQRYP